MYYPIKLRLSTLLVVQALKGLVLSMRFEIKLFPQDSSIVLSPKQSNCGENYHQWINESIHLNPQALLAKCRQHCCSVKSDLSPHHLHHRKCHTKYSDWLMLANYHFVSIYHHLYHYKESLECPDLFD